MTIVEDELAELHDLPAGLLLRPGTEGYEASYRPSFARFGHLRPAAVARCRTPSDVAAALALVRHAGMPMAIRSGGHDFAGRSSTTGLLIDLGSMSSIRLIDGDRVVVGPAVRLGDLYRVLHAAGRTVPGGSGLTVEVAGLTLGGGFGLLGRRHGLLCDHVVAAQVVLADGRILICDHEHHEDLFWMLRGAGAAGVGVVTQLTLATVPVPLCVAFELTWDYRHAAAVAAAWQDLAPEAPDGLAISLLLTVSADPDRSAEVAVQGTAADLSDEATRQLLQVFLGRVGARPATARQQEMSWLEARQWLGEGAPVVDDDGITHSRSGFFQQPLPRSAIEDLVAGLTLDRVAGEVRELDFSPWAGAYNRIPVDQTAFPHRAERFLLKHATITAPDTAVGVAEPSGWLTRSWTTVRGFGNGGVYPNFPDLDLPDPHSAYWRGNLRRVEEVRASYDPDALFDRLTTP